MLPLMTYLTLRLRNLYMCVYAISEAGTCAVYNTGLKTFTYHKIDIF